MTQIDLDLDSARTLDGSVEVLDEDEFLDHQIRYEYPRGLIAQTRTATQRVVDLVTAGAEPFGTAAESWLALVGHG